MPRHVVRTTGAPPSPPTYSQAVNAGGLVFVSGTGPFELGTGKVKGETISRRVRMNIFALEESRLDGRCLVPLCIAAPGPLGFCAIHRHARRAHGFTCGTCPLCKRRFDTADWVTSDHPIQHIACEPPRSPHRKTACVDRPLLNLADGKC
jgi:hypothetical protein